MNWESEVRWNRAVASDQGLTPWLEMRKWKRRFYFALAVAVIAVIVAILK